MEKRNEELVSEVENLLNSEELKEETKDVIKRLYNKYENNSFEDWNDRHQMYRENVERMVNDMGFQDEELAIFMAKNHPTLQQSFMRMVMKFIKKMAEDGKYFDGRNESSVMLARKIMESVDNTYLPFI